MADKETLALGRAAPGRPTSPGLAEVFALSYRRLVVQLYGVVGDLAEAEDLVQESFVRASAAGARFRRVDNPEAWLRRTAINLHRNRWRKLRNFGRVRPRLEASPPDPPGLEEHLAVIEALRRLPQSQREVLALHYLADQPVAEVAALLRVPEGTVKTRLMRGREALAVLLSEEALTEETAQVEEDGHE
ncbi:RNA polymerase sigma factor [Nocardioides sp. MAHUQ-72]|uniref:RNA polymerase sigma factor n=1 Tax=unclassified Nocardioides TaxID=2615069 RepID=UPI00361F65D6